MWNDVTLSYGMLSAIPKQKITEEFMEKRNDTPLKVSQKLDPIMRQRRETQLIDPLGWSQQSVLLLSVSRKSLLNSIY